MGSISGFRTEVRFDKIISNPIRDWWLCYNDPDQDKLLEVNGWIYGQMDERIDASSACSILNPHRNFTCPSKSRTSLI